MIALDELYLNCGSLLLVLLKLIVLFLISAKIFQLLTTGKCKSMACLVGKTAIVTGGSSGMGFETALVLASRGCRVIIADKNTSQKPKEKIIARTNNTNIEIKYVDLASLKSIREFVRGINNSEKRLDILINNAGVGAIGNKYTEDGLHTTMQINHFGPFLLTHLLVDLLKKSAPSRVVFVSSFLAFSSRLTLDSLNYPEDHKYSFLKICSVYSNSKLCNVISANGFAARLKKFNITVNSLHPGAVDTNIYTTFLSSNKYEMIIGVLAKLLFKMTAKTPGDGAQTALHIAVSNELKHTTGKHFWDCIPFFMPPKARDQEFCERIWERSETLVKLKESEKLKLDQNRRNSTEKSSTVSKVDELTSKILLSPNLRRRSLQAG